MALLGAALIFSPFVSSAHEVYVLSPATIAHDLSVSSPNPLGAFDSNRFQFMLWGFVAFLVVSTVFFASLTHTVEVLFEPYLTRMRPHAALVARVTLGLCLLASAYHMALFGPELPLSNFGSYAVFVQWVLYATGVAITFGLFARPAALAALLVFIGGGVLYGSYMLNYANYFGEMMVVLLLGGGALALFRGNKKPSKKLEEYAFLILRVGFGVAVAFAAIYAKFLHSNLALSTISEYHLTNYFHFDPLFIVLGACIIEVMMGVFFIFGFEIRHTSLFFLFWIFLSVLYFGESVWPHLVLVGVNIALFMYGYDKWTVEGRFFNRGKLQPFL